MTESPPAPAPASGTVRLAIHGMTCAACQNHVQRALQTVPGVASASVNLMAHTAEVTTSAPFDTASLLTAVHNSGYAASLPNPAGASMSGSMSGPDALMDMEGARLGLRTLLALLAGALAMLLSMPLMSATSPGAPTGVPGGPSLPAGVAHLASEMWVRMMPAALMSLPPQPLRWFLCALALATMLFAAPQIYAAAWRAARHRSTNMNTLVALGTLAAFASSFAATVAPAALARHGLASDVYYEAVVLILAFLLAGRWLEARARARATSALRGFAQLDSADARLLTLPAHSTDYTSAPETLLPLDAIEAGDLIRVLPGDRIPLDGLILHGRSSIDESMLTGEPLPITRNVGEAVRGGTLNLDGALVLRTTAVGADSTLAQMQRLLDSAQSSRAPMQRLADRASAIFVPTVLALAALTFAVWAIAENTGDRHAGLGRALSVAIAVLIIACPCAMGLAVPAAVTVSLGRAAQLGLLIKGGEALERLATVDTLALDKTGTLTEGRPRIVAFLPATNPGALGPDSGTRETKPSAPPLASPMNPDTSHLDSEMWAGVATPSGLDRATLLGIAAAAERLSTHPLARAVVDYADSQLNSVLLSEGSRGFMREPQSKDPEKSSSPQPVEPFQPQISDLLTLPGTGLTATVALPNQPTRKLSIGNASLLPTLYSLFPLPDSLRQATPLYLLLDDHLEAVFYATDELRPTAREALTELKTLGIHPLLLTGDTADSATPIAAQTGITDPQDIRAHLLPADKLAAIRTLQQQGHKVAMVGDGINDAAALAQSDAGLAMASGSDLAREAGDILLLRTDLRLIPAAIAIARRTTRIMRQNLGWALLYNVLGLPIAAGVLYPHFHLLLSPVLASLAMALSSVSVLANSLRLRRLP